MFMINFKLIFVGRAFNCLFELFLYLCAVFLFLIDFYLFVCDAGTRHWVCVADTLVIEFYVSVPTLDTSLPPVILVLGFLTPSSGLCEPAMHMVHIHIHIHLHMHIN